MREEEHQVGKRLVTLNQQLERTQSNPLFAVLAETLPIAVDDGFKGLDQLGVNAGRATGDEHFQHTLQLSLSEAEERAGAKKSEEFVNRLDVEQCLRVREGKEGDG